LVDKSRQARKGAAVNLSSYVLAETGMELAVSLWIGSRMVKR
tara:strand:+ start:4860 stop:4985 length:126 start_codon:yes stop_codon:yes gene_type:complete